MSRKIFKSLGYKKNRLIFSRFFGISGKLLNRFLNWKITMILIVGPLKLVLPRS